MSSETRLVLIMAMCVLLGGGAMYLMNGTPAISPPPPATPAPIEWTADRYAGVLKQARHVRGDSKAARITLIEFGDFECPSCRRAYNTYLVKIEKIMPIQLAFFHFPLVQHLQGIPAAIATEAAARQNKFWPMFDALYMGAETKVDSALILTSARKAGLDIPRFTKDCADPALNQLVQTDLKLGGTLHVSQTPTFFVRDDKTGRIGQGAGAAGVDAVVMQMTGTPSLLPAGSSATP